MHESDKEKQDGNDGDIFIEKVKEYIKTEQRKNKSSCDTHEVTVKYPTSARLNVD